MIEQRLFSFELNKKYFVIPSQREIFNKKKQTNKQTQKKTSKNNNNNKQTNKTKQNKTIK